MSNDILRRYAATQARAQAKADAIRADPKAMAALLERNALFQHLLAKAKKRLTPPPK